MMESQGISLEVGVSGLIALESLAPRRPAPRVEDPEASRKAAEAAASGLWGLLLLNVHDAGADPRGQDSEGRTALHWLVLNSGSPTARSHPSIPADIARSLLLAGADPFARDFDRRTPLDLLAMLPDTPARGLLRERLTGAAQ